MLGDIKRPEPAEQAIRVLGDLPQVAVQLLIPVWDPGRLGQVLHLVNVAAAQTATVTLLQRHHIVVADQPGDSVQVFDAVAIGQHMLPAAGEIMSVGGGVDSHLNIERQQSKVPVRLEFRHMVEAGAAPPGRPGLLQLQQSVNLVANALVHSPAVPS